MRQPPPSPPVRRCDHLSLALTGVAGAAILAALVLTPSDALAQRPTVHLNPVIAKLVAGKTVYGLSTGDVSLASAREMATAPADFVYIDMEHNPLDFPALRVFLLGMGDKGRILQKGNVQPNVALFARFPPAPEYSEWVVKQALDIGLHGVLFNGVDTPEQAAFAVKTMRYSQLKTSAYPEPNGIRGVNAPNAVWAWGVTADEYERRADLWPLNPDGDLLAVMMVESAEGLKNVDAIAALPGVGALFPGSGGDLSRSLGVRQGTPELEAAFQQILRACKTHNVACAISANNGEDVARRVREGWKIIRTNVAAANAGRALLGEVP